MIDDVIGDDVGDVIVICVGVAVQVVVCLGCFVVGAGVRAPARHPPCPIQLHQRHAPPPATASARTRARLDARADVQVGDAPRALDIGQLVEVRRKERRRADAVCIGLFLVLFLVLF